MVRCVCVLPLLLTEPSQSTPHFDLYMACLSVPCSSLRFTLVGSGSIFLCSDFSFAKVTLPKAFWVV